MKLKIIPGIDITLKKNLQNIFVCDDNTPEIAGSELLFHNSRLADLKQPGRSVIPSVETDCLQKLVM